MFILELEVIASLTNQVVGQEFGGFFSGEISDRDST